jgi:hypothetical protein
MNKIEKTLHRCLIDLYSGEAILTALPGYYEQRMSCGYAIETNKYCCMLHPHRSSDVSFALAGYHNYNIILDRKISFEQFKTIQEFCKILTKPEILPIFRNDYLTWDILDQVGLKKKIIQKGDRAGRDWAVTILKNSMVFELQGSPVREVFCVQTYAETGHASIWYANKLYPTQWIKNCFPELVESYVKDEERTNVWLNGPK